MNIFRIVTFIIAVIMFLMGKHKYGRLVNPICAFNLLWIVILFFIPFSKEFGVYEPSNQALVIVYIGILSVNAGLLISSKIRCKHKYKSTSLDFNKKTMTLFTLIALVSVIFLSIDSIRLLLSGSTFSLVREAYYNVGSDGSLIYYFKNYVSLPLQYLVVICAIKTIFEKKPNKFYIFSALVIVVLQVFQSGGRYLLLNSLYILLAGFGLYSFKKKISWKIRLFSFSLVLLLVFGIAVLTNDRTTSYTENLGVFQKILTTFYHYFIGSVTYCGNVLQKSPFLEGSTYGMNFLAGFIEPFAAFLRFLRVINYPETLTYIGTYACEQMSIGTNVYYNAMPTMFMYFYMDFGIFGVIFESIIFGFVAIKIYEAYCTNKSFLAFGFYCLFFVVLMNSSTRYFLYTPSFALSFIYLYMTKIAIPKKYNRLANCVKTA